MSDQGNKAVECFRRTEARKLIQAASANYQKILKKGESVSLQDRFPLHCIIQFIMMIIKPSNYNQHRHGEISHPMITSAKTLQNYLICNSTNSQAFIKQKHPSNFFLVETDMPQHLFDLEPSIWPLLCRQSVIDGNHFNHWTVSDPHHKLSRMGTVSRQRGRDISFASEILEHIVFYKYNDQTSSETRIYTYLKNLYDDVNILDVLSNKVICEN